MRTTTLIAGAAAGLALASGCGRPTASPTIGGAVQQLDPLPAELTG